MTADNSDIPAIRKFKSFIIQDIKNRFKVDDKELDDTCKQATTIATFLDPKGVKSYADIDQCNLSKSTQNQASGTASQETEAESSACKRSRLNQED
ncbi:hypothetical protein KUTeg_011799, partial [Tegillarca granosa]